MWEDAPFFHSLAYISGQTYDHRENFVRDAYLYNEVPFKFWTWSGPDRICIWTRSALAEVCAFQMFLLELFCAVRLTAVVHSHSLKISLSTPDTQSVPPPQKQAWRVPSSSSQSCEQFLQMI